MKHKEKAANKKMAEPLDEFSHSTLSALMKMNLEFDF